ncbi:MAG: winged helix-turn-helix transcriptional regulator [Cyclobacteriaceae bacterium]|nr:winged helix-turn-helix transcriptional regulator [Cyclobacteriaceae bacterium]
MRLTKFNLSLGTQIMKALGDEARLRILNLLLKKGPMTISDLEHILEFTQTKTSRHITYLKNSGMLTSEKLDQWVVYTIKDEVHEIIDQFVSFVEKDGQLKDDLDVYSTLFNNRELAQNKIPQRRWQSLKNI